LGEKQAFYTSNTPLLYYSIKNRSMIPFYNPGWIKKRWVVFIILKPPTRVFHLFRLKGCYKAVLLANNNKPLPGFLALERQRRRTREVEIITIGHAKMMPDP
jgi:hypothetical protein